MRHLDLFSGIGGFALAARWMGWQTIGFVEKDKFCQKVLTKNFNGVPIYDDITTFSGKPFRGRVDIITGGFPCQPFSHAGERKGVFDERHLFPQMLRVVQEVEPIWVVAENVRGLLSIESGRVFSEIITSLESEGYEVITFCIPASAVDAPHRRDRIWFIAFHPERAGCQGSTGEAKTVQNCNGKKDGLFVPANCHVADSGSRRLQRTQSENSGFNSKTQGKRNQQTNDVEGFYLLASDSSELFGNGSDNNGRIGAQGKQISELGNGFGTAFITDPDEQRSKNKRRSQIDRQDQIRTSENNGHQTPKLESSFGWTRDWFEVATALCRVDDGLPRQLDRANRLKALGNAVVPQIAYEIFKAIEETEKSLCE